MTHSASSLRRYDLAMQAHARRILIISFGTLALAAFAAQAEGDAVAADKLSIEQPAATTGAEMTPVGEAQPPRSGGLSIDMAFARADLDRDGQLTRKETARFPAIHERFDEIDLDANGHLNLLEFEGGVLHPHP